MHSSFLLSPITIIPTTTEPVTTTIAPTTTTYLETTTSCATFDQPRDVVFVVDASASVGADNYPKQLDFVKRLTQNFNLTETGTRAAFVSYTIGDGDSITEFGFQTNYEDFETQVNAIEYADGFTLTGAAMPSL